MMKKLLLLMMNIQYFIITFVNLATTNYANGLVKIKYISHKDKKFGVHFINMPLNIDSVKRIVHFIYCQHQRIISTCLIN